MEDGDGLRAMDYVVRHSAAPDFMMAEATLLERIAHQLHMQQLWARAGREYAAMGPPSPAFCGCAATAEAAARLEAHLTEFWRDLRHPFQSTRNVRFLKASTPLVNRLFIAYTIKNLTLRNAT